MARLVGTVLKSSAKISPSSTGPVFREGRLTMTGKGDETEELKATPQTKITLDGKPAKFKAATPGTLVLRAMYDPATKEIYALDLKSGPRETAAGVFTGEVAGTDVLRDTLSLRTGPHSEREFTVTGDTTLLGRDGKPLAFEAIKVGDAVEVTSRDGKSAHEVRALPAP